MPYNTKKSLKDADGKSIAQVYDPVADEFKPLTTDDYKNKSIVNFPANQAVSDAAVAARLEAIETRLNQTLDTKLTGRNVEKVFAFNATTILDTSYHVSSSIDLSKYGEIFIYALNTLGQDVNLYPLVDGKGFKTWDGTQYSSDAGIAVLPSTGSYYYNVTSELATLRFFENVEFVAQCPVAPTSGIFTVKILGVPN